MTTAGRNPNKKVAHSLSASDNEIALIQAQADARGFRSYSAYLISLAQADAQKSLGVSSEAASSAESARHSMQDSQSLHSAVASAVDAYLSRGGTKHGPLAVVHEAELVRLLLGASARQFLRPISASLPSLRAILDAESTHQSDSKAQ